MFKLSSVRDLFLLLFVVYYAQGSLYSGGSFFSQAALALILVISLVFLIKTIQFKNKENVLYIWIALLLLNVVGFVFSGDLRNPYHFGMFKGIIISSLPFFTCYYLSRRGILLSKHLIIFFFIMLPICVLQFYYNQNQVLAVRISNSDDLVNNIAYTFVGLIPFLFFFTRNRLLSSSLMVLLMFFIMQGAKRGALIAGTIGVCFFIFYQLRGFGRKHTAWNYAIVLIGIVIISYFAIDFYQKNDFLVSRMQRIGEDGGSSGRDVIYSNIFFGWLNSNNIFNLLFGFGFAGSLELSGAGRFAHNDWFELLSNFGLLGLVIYLLLFYSLFVLPQQQKWSFKKRMVLFTIVAIWFFTSLVSMSYSSQTGYSQAILVGFLVGNRNREII